MRRIILTVVISFYRSQRASKPLWNRNEFVAVFVDDLKELKKIITFGLLLLQVSESRLQTLFYIGWRECRIHLTVLG